MYIYMLAFHEGYVDAKRNNEKEYDWDESVFDTIETFRNS